MPHACMKKTLTLAVALGHIQTGTHMKQFYDIKYMYVHTVCNGP